jgi:hypothetical protein
MKRIRVFLTALLVGAFMFLSPNSAFAESVMTTITCAKADGISRDFQVGWDNSNQFFNGRGEIPRLYCEGGFAGAYTIYVRDLLALDDPRRWFNGVAPSPSPEPTPEPTPEVTPEPTPEIVVPTPVVTQTPEPEPTASIEPTLNPEPTPMPEPTQEPTPDVTPSETATPTVEPTPEATQAPEPIATPTTEPEPEPTLEPTPTPIATPELEPQEQLPEPQAVETPEPEPTVDTSEPPLEPTLEPTADEVTQAIVDDALADGVLTDTERELVADALVEEFAGEAITFEALQEAGLDFEDLPPDQPVTLENGVILTAEVADALEIFESGAEVLATLLENPAKALKAIANVGQDMTPEERETSQNTVVAAVVVTQVAQVRKIK